MKSTSTIRKHLKKLRELIDSSKDPIEKRVAYAMEQAVRWAIEDTAGWSGLAQEAKEEAGVLKRELEK